MKRQIAMRRGQFARLGAVASVLLVVIAGLPRQVHAQQAPVPVNCGDTISASGHYELAAGCTNFLGNAITIQASDVRLDLRGLTISGPGISAANCSRGPAVNDGIVVSASVPPARNVRIENGRIEGFVYGVSLLSANDSTLQTLRLTRDCNGILLLNAYENNIRDNTVSESLLQGIALTSSNSNWIHRNTGSGNGVDAVAIGGATGGGLLLVDSSFNVMAANGIVGSGNYGIALTSSTLSDPNNPGSASNVLLNNTISNGNSVGIRIQKGNVNVLIDNIANNNGGDGIDIASSENLVHNNVANNNLVRGILVNPGASGNVIRRNTALGNRAGDLVDLNLPSCVNIWRGNNFVTDNELGSDRGPDAGCIR